MTPAFPPSNSKDRTLFAGRVALAVVVLIVVILAAHPAGAQTPSGAQPVPALTSLTVDLWPEFDQPSMLVMYQFSLSADFKAPGEVRVRIPADAGAPNAVAVCEAAGSCYDTPFTQEPAGEWTTLIISATLPDVRVEYYDPRLQKNGRDRHFEFQWPGDFAVENFRVHVQQPAEALQMRLKPGSASQGVEDDGLTYYTLDVGSVPAGQPVAIEMDYVKNSDALSNTSLPVQPIEPLDSQAGTSNVSSLPLALGGVGVALILGGGLWYWYSGRQRTTSKEPRRRRRKTTQPAAPASDASSIYCHQCGNRAAAGDRFCRTCGAPLRKG